MTGQSREFVTRTYERDYPGTAVLVPTKATCTLEESNYGSGNNEVQYYLPENVFFHDDGVAITAQPTEDAPQGYEFTSGMVRWRPEGGFAPGDIITYNVHVSHTFQGVWPAIWASSWYGKWPATELDIFEMICSRNKVKTAVHYKSSRGHEQRESGGPIERNDYSGSVEYLRGGGFLASMTMGNGEEDWTSVMFSDVKFDPRAYTHHTIHPEGWAKPVPEIKINLALGGNPGPLSEAMREEGAFVEFNVEVALTKSSHEPVVVERLVDTHSWTV